MLLEVVLAEVWFAVVGDGIEGDGGAEAFALEVGDGLGAVAGEAAVAQRDGFATQVARGFVADVFELECVVGADFAGGFEEEEFLVEFALLEVANASEIEAEAVEGFHAVGAVLTEVIGVFDPAGELVVEFFEGGDVGEVAAEELVTHGAEEAFDFAFGGSIAHGGVEEDGAEAGADLAELLGGVV